MSSIIEKVETFIQRLNDLDYIINPERGDALYGSPSNSTVLNKSLADHLANAISVYESNRDSNNVEIKAILCNLWISRAFTQGAVQEGKGLAGKLKECQERNVQLERDIIVLSEKYLILKTTHDAFSSRLSLLDENDLEEEK